MSEAVRDLTSMEALRGRMSRGIEAEDQLPALREEERFLTEQKLRAQQDMTKQLAQEGVRQEEQFGKTLREAQATRKAETVPEPEFKPSKMELDDYRNLAGMLVGIGMLAGTSGKSGAMYALSSLNGMMKGFAEGRRDLFKNEQVVFDKQLRSIDATNKRVQRDFEDAMSLLQTDRQAGVAKLARLKAELGDSVLGVELQLNNLSKVRSDLKDRVAAGEKAVNLFSTLQDRQEARDARAEETRLARESREEYQRESLGIRRQQLAISQEQLRLRQQQEKQKAEGGGKQKTLAGGEVRRLDGLDSIAKGLEDLQRTFKPEFASLGFLGVGAELSLEAKRRLPPDVLNLFGGDAKLAQEAVTWWGKYNLLQAPNRHSLFGATLTENELRNYRSFTAKTSDQSTIIKNLLNNQINYIRDTAESQRSSFKDSGYKVPNIATRNVPDYYGTYDTPPSGAQRQNTTSPQGEWSVKEKK